MQTHGPPQGTQQNRLTESIGTTGIDDSAGSLKTRSGHDRLATRFDGNSRPGVRRVPRMTTTSPDFGDTAA